MSSSCRDWNKPIPPPDVSCCRPWHQVLFWRRALWEAKWLQEMTSNSMNSVKHVVDPVFLLGITHPGASSSFNMFQPYPSSHNHGSMKNGSPPIVATWNLSNTAIFHVHDYGRKCRLPYITHLRLVGHVHNLWRWIFIPIAIIWGWQWKAHQWKQEAKVVQKRINEWFGLVVWGPVVWIPIGSPFYERDCYWPVYL